MTAAAVGRESGMKPNSNWIELSGLCALFILLSIWGIVWDVSSGLLTSGIDGIMLLFICLMMGGIFSLMLVVMLWQAGLIPVFKKAEGKPAESAKAAPAAKSATPAPAASPASASSPAAPAPASAPAQKTSQPVPSTPSTK
jgi:predicted lipid-binding transport protein (Tim44 family)